MVVCHFFGGFDVVYPREPQEFHPEFIYLLGNKVPAGTHLPCFAWIPNEVNHEFVTFILKSRENLMMLVTFARCAGEKRI